MKRIITVFIITLLIYSCSMYKSVTDSTYLGMTKKEFMQEVKYPSLEMDISGSEITPAQYIGIIKEKIKNVT